jgi:hypothetical protein
MNKYNKLSYFPQKKKKSFYFLTQRFFNVSTKKKENEVEKKYRI